MQREKASLGEHLSWNRPSQHKTKSDSTTLTYGKHSPKTTKILKLSSLIKQHPQFVIPASEVLKNRTKQKNGPLFTALRATDSSIPITSRLLPLITLNDCKLRYSSGQITQLICDITGKLQLTNLSSENTAAFFLDTNLSKRYFCICTKKHC